MREFLSDRTKKNYGQPEDVGEQPKPASPQHTLNVIFGGAEISVT